MPPLCILTQFSHFESQAEFSNFPANRVSPAKGRPTSKTRSTSKTTPHQQTRSLNLHSHITLHQPHRMTVSCAPPGMCPLLASCFSLSSNSCLSLSSQFPLTLFSFSLLTLLYLSPLELTPLYLSPLNLFSLSFLSLAPLNRFSRFLVLLPLASQPHVSHDPSSRRCSILMSLCSCHGSCPPVPAAASCPAAYRRAQIFN